MDRLKKAALLTRLIEKLRERGSWCGETHVQKAAFLLQELMRVPLEYDFVLYKHGPFSFDLRDELTSLRADGLITLEPQWPYGPKLRPTARAQYIQDLNTNTVTHYDGKIAFVVEMLGDKDVSVLERLATALYVTQQAKDSSVEARVKRLTELKPHISQSLAKEAVEEIDRISQAAKGHLH
jgi:uncharacterized protein YwgA